MRASKFVALVAATVFTLSSLAVSQAESLITNEAMQVMTDFTSKPKFQSDKFLLFGIAVSTRGKLDYAGHFIQLIHIDKGWDPKVIELARRYNELDAQLNLDDASILDGVSTSDSTSDRVDNLLAEVEGIFSGIKKDQESSRQYVVGIIKSAQSGISGLEEYVKSQEAMLIGEAKVTKNYLKTTAKLSQSIASDIEEITYATDVLEAEHLNDAGRYLERVINEKRARLAQLDTRIGQVANAHDEEVKKFFVDHPAIGAWKDESNPQDQQIASSRIIEATDKMKQDLKVKKQNVQVAMAGVYIGVGLVDLGDAAAKGYNQVKYAFNKVQLAARSSKLKNVNSAIASGAITEDDVIRAKEEIAASKANLANAKQYLAAAIAEEAKLESYIDGLESFSPFKGIFDRSILD